MVKTTIRNTNWRNPGMNYRAERRAENSANQRLVNSLNDEREKPREKIVAQIAALLRDAGYEFVDVDIFKGLSKEQVHSLENRVLQLAHTPRGQESDTFLPWAGVTPSVKSLRKFVRNLPFPVYAKDLLLQTADSMSKPATQGMMWANGKPNKDLAQLLDRAQPFNWSDEFSRHYEKAMERHVAEFREWVTVTDPFGYTVSEEGKVQLIEWDMTFYREQMKNSIQEASPGFPFIGQGWEDVLDDGKTPLEKSLYTSMLSVTDPELYAAEVSKWTNYIGFIFVQGARWTGDAGENGDGEGHQRLVQAACCLIEKLFSHMLAIAYQRFYKAPGASGQRGIQACTEYLKDIAQGRKEPSGRVKTISHWCSWDVSKWDKAQTDEFAERGFFEFMRRTLDLNDPLTAKILDKYTEGYFNRILYTAAGCFNPGFLPSGAGITTTLAFNHHTLILYVIDEIVKEKTGEYLLSEFGLQGDDFVAGLSQWTPEIEQIVKETYAAFNCVIKGDMRVRSAIDPDCNVVFLNECIYLADDRMNARPVKWNFWMAEDFSSLQRGVSMDRMLMVEIKTRCPHPSKRELEFVSLVSKLDRFHGPGDEKMPFYDILLEKVRRWCQFPLRSWLGERVISSDSPTIKELQALERAEGIERPDDITCALDRQEENWLTVQEIGYVSRILFEAAIDLDTKPHTRKLISVARNLRSWREAGNVLSGFQEQEPIERKMNMNKAIEDIMSAYQKGYAAAEKAAAEQEVHVSRQQLIEAEERGELMPPDSTPVLVKTAARAIFALNSANPYELVEHSYKTLMAIYNSRNWASREDKDREALDQICYKLFGHSLDALSREHQRVSDL